MWIYLVFYISKLELALVNAKLETEIELEDKLEYEV